MDNNDDIEDVIREEERRGRRPIDFAARKERTKALWDMQVFLNIRTETEFLSAMCDQFGLPADSPRILACLQIWRDYRS